MKLSAAVDLTGPKAAAVSQIDAAYLSKFGQANVMDDLYRIKTALAQAAMASGATPDPSLVTEAALKGITVAALCADILAKRAAQVQTIAALEAARQTAKKQIATITDQHTLNATLATILAAAA